MRYPKEILGDDDGTMPENVEKLASEVVGHRIVAVEKGKWDGSWGYQHGHLITLDNGKQVRLADTSDCCASTALEAFMLSPDSVDHVITGIGTTGGYTTWHIFADGKDILNLTVEWSAGNPFYYSYGFDISVADAPPPSSKYARAARPDICWYLESVGVDPATVGMDEITATGYYRYAVDEFGKMIRDAELRVWTEWPTVSIGARVIDMLKPWEESS